MQVSITQPATRNWLKSVSVTAQVMLFIAALIYLYYTKDNLISAYKLATKAYASTKTLYALVAVFALVPINYLSEAYKWTFSYQRNNQKLALFEAYKAVIISLSLGTFMPPILADFATRAKLSKPKNLVANTEGLLLANYAQFIWAMIGGCFAVTASILIYRINTGYLPLLILPITALMLISYFKAEALHKLLTEIKNESINRLFKKWTNTAPIQLPKLRPLLFYAGLRYCTFMCQLALLLWLFSNIATVHYAPLTLCTLATGFLCAKSLMPRLNFISEAGVRVLAIVSVFGSASTIGNVVLQATTVSWLLNIMLPAIISWPFSIYLFGRRSNI